MGIYLPNMEMPEERESFTLTIKYNGLVFDTETGIQVAEAQEVPTHGRLIDASESIRVELYDEEHEDWTRHDMTIDDLLSQSWVDADAPTIIPAEPFNNLSEPCKEGEA